MKARAKAVVGVSDHAGWAVLLAVAPDGTVIDRRRIALVADGLPVLPHHHDAQLLDPGDGVALVERVRASAEQCARAAFEALASEVAVTAIALRRCPELPPTIAERIASYRAQTMADTVMYREVLADVARARGWTVAWYEPKLVLADAARALGKRSIDTLLRDTGKALGPPWQKDHRIAMAAAIAATTRVR